MKSCCIGAAGSTALAIGIQSCGSIYYATATMEDNLMVLNKSEFLALNKKKEYHRKFIMIQKENMDYPICLYNTKKDEYTASLLKCTHRGCELNVGGGVYSCPCHGSEFSIQGEVLQGPADQDLQTYPIKTDNENIYIQLS